MIDLPGPDISLLLDFDGTLVDLAADPMAIKVDRLLIETLEKILCLGHVRLAIVTGRQINVLDDFMGLPGLAVSGNHGTEFRPPGSELVTRRALPMPAELKESIASLCRKYGAVFEDKRETAVAHVRSADDVHPLATAMNAVAPLTQDYILWETGFSIEILRRGFSKVTGVTDMLATRIFKDRPAIYIGDDAETYPGLSALAAMNVSLCPVGPGKETGLHAPRDVHEFLDKIACGHANQRHAARSSEAGAITG